jgi:hypothetical protein
MRAPEPAGGGGMDNRIFLGTIAQRGKFAGRHNTGRKIKALREYFFYAKITNSCQI